VKLGDTLTIAGVEFQVRPFTAAEHQAFDVLAEQRQLQRKAAEVQALANTRGGTAREALLQADIRGLRERLKKYMDGKNELKRGLSQEKRLEAFELATEIDTLTERIEHLRQERFVEAQMREEELAQARETVVVAFMHSVLKPNMTLEEFYAALTPTELVQLEELAALGKLRTGLSASSRRQAAMWDQQLQAIMRQAQQNDAGNDSASPPQPPAAPAKPGPSGRSKTSSSKSKAGA